ncbi:DUF4236 domain-containing protein [Stappia sp. TSB10P1A]|uniref:DUF4236 domain-containing protein n=1 Tax=Stappia sp. TSB10P1A TaxID=2003585 RepID=UPI001643C376|nr:DUF4236 domain-containing protein [Stappia sp. TSB10P1A]
MPFYIRKSVSAGPFRFNFSKGGVGLSVGVRGLRVGTGPRGHYIHAGRGGLYYRSSIKPAGTGPAERTPPPAPRPDMAPEATSSDDVEMIEIESADVLGMRDETFGHLLDEINRKSGQIKMSSAFCWTAIIVTLVAGFASGGVGFLFGLAAIPGWMIGRWLDSYRRSSVLYYDLEGDAEAAYRQLVEGFDSLQACKGKWHIEESGAVTSDVTRKRNAGASHLVKRKTTPLSYSLPDVIKSNLTPPALGVGKQTLFFMPDTVLVQDGSRFGAVSYSDLTVHRSNSRFIEDGAVPSDAQVVGHTWKHPNKNGGPDRRFRDNRQLPICLYESIQLRSATGLNELVEFSQAGKGSGLESGCRQLAGLPKGKTSETPLPPRSDAGPTPEASPQPQPEKRRSTRRLILAVFALLVGLPIIVTLVQERAVKPDASLKLAAPAPAPNARQEETVRPPSVTDSRPPDNRVADNPILVTSTAVNLREGPSTLTGILMTVPKGGAVRRLGQKEGWSHVETQNGMIGWMSSEFLVSR